MTPPSPFRRRSARARRALAALAAVLALSACGGSGYQYVADSASHSFFKVPAGWKLFDQTALFPTAPRTNPFRDEQNPTQFVMGFAADPRVQASSFPSVSSTAPEGFALVHVLSPVERDAASLSVIRNAVFPIDQMYQQDPNSVVIFSSEDISSDSGLRGSHIVFSMRQSPDPTRPYTGSVTVNQTGMLDPGTQKLYLFLVFCSSDCYSQNQKTIERIADSWIVREQP